ncbi:MAG TPA: 5'-methylthioadenosine/S-adenosylhomocysteine nucleosidase [Candidatus Omnitrophota bacterium]|nr:5'-methylthioadenosine/S-adenosylhomocysteine nucleosidase [Candidatus Omnitrophota bacterium]
MIGIICPSQFEYEVLSRAHLTRKGDHLVLSGMGKLRAAHACHRLARDHDVKWILLIGYAGGLSNLSVGDVMEPDTFIEQDYFAEPFEKFPNILSKEDPKRLLGSSKSGLMLTQDRFLTSNPYKDSEYAKKYPRIACDMESYAVAHFCRESGLPYSVVKLISDSADANADHDFLKACRELAPLLNDTALDCLEKIRAALRRPSADLLLQ